MAKTQSKGKTPVAPNFRTIDKESAQRAKAALAGGRQEPLKVPAGAKVSTDKNGTQYTRWTERATVTQAYRSVSKSGLMEIVIGTKIRQSAKNDGKSLYGRFYFNLDSDVPENHVAMNDRTNGAMISVLQATGYMPESGTVNGSVLDKMFPSKGQPGVSSPLLNKSVVVATCQTLGPQKDPKTNKPILDDDDEPILQKEDKIESFLPDAPVEDDEDEDEDEVEESDDEESDDDESEDEDEADDDESDESGDDDDDTDEDEDEDPAPRKPVAKAKAVAPVKSKTIVKKKR